MIVNDDTIIKLADLARLKLNAEEFKKFKKDIPSILKQLDKLTEVDTENVEAISQVTWLKNSTRKDEIINCAFSEELTNQAPGKSDNWSFLVKNVL